MRPPSREPEPADAAQERIYFPGLDGLRALAIFMVYAFHDHHLDLLGYLTAWVEVPLTLFVDPILGVVGLPATSIHARLLIQRPFRTNGWAGVQVFFVLSGFLITTLLLRERERYGRVDLRAFWVRRALRIWPLYYLVVLIGFGIYPWLGSGTTPTEWRRFYGAQLPAFLAFLGNWSMVFWGQMPDPISILWSVCVEEQFYLFVPLFVAIRVPRWRIPVLVVLIAASAYGRYWMAASGIKDVTLRYNSLANLDTLLAGVLLALVGDRYPKLIRSGWPWRLVVVAGTILVVTVPLCQGEPVRMAVDQVGIWVWSLGLVVVAATPGDRWAAPLRRPTVIWLGQISYGLYLLHELGIALVMGLGSWLPALPEKGLLLAVLGPVVTIAMAAASYRWIEQPFLSLKKRWTRVPSRPIDATSASK